MNNEGVQLVCGWGINDVDYPVHRYEKVEGKTRQKCIWVCPYYRKWCGVLIRCFDQGLHKKHPTYIGCTICDEWKYLSNFIKWVDSQPNRDWINCDLDKDFLSTSNKHYSPETAVFVPSKVNKFVLDSGKVRGAFMIGVKISPNKKNPYIARCNNPFNSKERYIGLFPTELEAHLAWQAKKHEYACLLAEQQQDPRVAKALRERYAPDKDWTNNKETT